eukprot:8027248-Pyramimonas_sp.AAC.1
MGVLLGARARLKGGTAAGSDGLVAEIFKAIPWDALRLIRHSFQEIHDQKKPLPDSWRALCVQLIPKLSVNQTFGDTREISLLSVMSK